MLKDTHPDLDAKPLAFSKAAKNPKADLGDRYAAGSEASQSMLSALATISAEARPEFEGALDARMTELGITHPHP